jgi:hypothetical protein
MIIRRIEPIMKPLFGHSTKERANIIINKAGKIFSI